MINISIEYTLAVDFEQHLSKPKLINRFLSTVILQADKLDLNKKINFKENEDD